jgi:hypothetical protein
MRVPVKVLGIPPTATEAKVVRKYQRASRFGDDSLAYYARNR